LHMSAAPPQGGLTPALGGKKHSAFALSALQLIGFGQHCSSDGSWARCFFGQVRYARSHSACVALPGFGSNGLQSASFPLLTRDFGHGQLKFRGARPGVRASVFGNFAGVSVSPASGPPNKSFKPTPCRGIGHVLCATLARVRRPATGRLNSGVRRQKAFGSCIVSTATYRLRSALLFGLFVGTSLLRSSSSGALTHHMHCVGRLRQLRLLSFGFAAPDAVVSDRSG
jgi:hypothetical protein